MEQFSHDLTLALEETSRSGGVRLNRWGFRRRTRSTGNLPCAPQPTEDSSSSPADHTNNLNQQIDEGQINSILSDSDDRQELKLSLKARQSCLFGNFESDSLNENFSPARPNTRRKRKCKRMAVEYETTPSTPGNNQPAQIFPIAGTVKKRVLKHTNQENFRANLFFCGKRKRSHRDRYYDNDHKQHSSSVPRQRDLFLPKSSYMEYRNRNRSFSKPCERILPLNKSIISKIEKISQDTKNKIIGGGGVIGVVDIVDGPSTSKAFQFPYIPSEKFDDGKSFMKPRDDSTDILKTTQASNDLQLKIPHKSDSFESTFGVQQFGSDKSTCNVGDIVGGGGDGGTKVHHHHYNQNHSNHHHHHHHQLHNNNHHYNGNNTRKHNTNSKKLHIKMQQLQFDDPNAMECGNFNEFLSSSSLSSSDSEAAQTNDSDREGDDELTDWPGNEAMVNFTSKNDFKRARPRNLSQSSTNRTALPLINSDEFGQEQDDDTLMSADEINYPFSTTHQQLDCTNYQPPNTLNLSVKYSPANADNIIFEDKNQSKILGGGEGGGGGGSGRGTSMTPTTLTAGTTTSIITTVASTMPIDIATAVGPIRNQIESEMSGETSNHFLSSPNTSEVREIRAGCRRVRAERPGFTILTSVNEELAKFLQAASQTQLTLPDTDEHEHEKLVHLALLYSLKMEVENGCAILTKTSNTTQSVKIDQKSLSSKFLSDFKRRCYDGNADDA